MNSLTASLTANLSGAAEGSSLNPDNFSPLIVALSATLASTSTGGAKATKVLYYPSRSLGAGLTDTFDLTNFTNAIGETGQGMTVVRAVVLSHPSTSAASSVRWGNAASNPFVSLIDGGASTATFPAGTGMVQFIATAAGAAVDSTHKNVAVANLDGTNAATYTLVVLGE